MPTQTFFRLPEEKRARLTVAAWEEFTRVPFSEASINRIIRSACIPRGSFYQYFADKEDLFNYLQESINGRYLALAAEAIARSGGDLFAAALCVFDLMFGEGGTARRELTEGMQVLRLNPSMDAARMLVRWLLPAPEIEGLLAQIDCSGFRSSDREFVGDVLVLLISSLMFAMRSLIDGGGEYEGQRERLRSRIEIVRRGSLREEKIS